MTEVARQTYGVDSPPAAGMKELFVINLCASMTPMPDVPRQLNGYEKYRLYQIAKMEDGRRRYRLRMGFFSNETDAEFLVASIRSMYPAALVSCAVSEDLRFAETDLPAHPQTGTADGKPAASAGVVATVAEPLKDSQKESPKAAPRPVASSAAVEPIAKAAPVKADAAKPPAAAPATKAAPAATSASVAPTTPLPTVAATRAAPATTGQAPLTLVDPPAPTSSATAAASSNDTEVGDTHIFHVGRGIEIPESSLELTAEELPPAKHPVTPAMVSKTAPVKDTPVNDRAVSDKPVGNKVVAPKPVATAPAAPSKPAVASPNAPAVKPGTATANAKPVAAKPAAQAPSQPQPILAATIQAPAAKDDYVPILDTTLTIRTLTKSEADDPNRPKWFVVQLASSERPIDISTMPKLDIFAAYSLYCVALMEQGGIRHTLRLGFFKEQVSADAVMGYLKTFFNSPCVTQISSAEYDRFTADKPQKPAQAAPPAVPAQPTRAAMPHTGKPTAVTLATKPVVPKVILPPPRNEAGKSQSFLSRLIGKQLD